MSDIDFDTVYGTIDAEQLYQRMTIFYRCPISDHLWIFWSGLDSPPTLYEPRAMPDT